MHVTRWLLAGALVVAGFAAPQAPPSLCEVVGLTCATTTEVRVDPATLTVPANATVALNVTVAYTYLRAGAATSEPTTAVELTATAGPGLVATPANATLEVPVSAGTGPEATEQRTEEVSTEIVLRCAAPGTTTLNLSADAQPNGNLAASNGTVDLEVTCAAPPAPPPAPPPPPPPNATGPPRNNTTSPPPAQEPARTPLPQLATVGALAAAAMGLRRRRT